MCVHDRAFGKHDLRVLAAVDSSLSLPIQQVLILWDRIIAFDDLSLLGVLAAAIFSYRRIELLRATTREEVGDDDGFVN